MQSRFAPCRRSRPAFASSFEGDLHELTRSDAAMHGTQIKNRYNTMLAIGSLSQGGKSNGRRDATIFNCPWGFRIYHGIGAFFGSPSQCATSDTSIIVFERRFAVAPGRRSFCGLSNVF